MFIQIYLCLRYIFVNVFKLIYLSYFIWKKKKQVIDMF